jgi:Sulfotransferase family
MPIDPDFVNDCYMKYLGRPAEDGGLRYYMQFESIVDMEHEIVGSQEFIQKELVLHYPRSFHSWKICVLEEAKIVFVPIAKCAHTSIVSALFDFKKINWRMLNVPDAEVQASGTDDDFLHYALGNNKTGILLKDHSPEFSDRIMRDKDWLRVAVLRDPVARFLSAYHHFFIQWRNHPLGLRHTKVILDALGGNFDANSDSGMIKVLKYFMTQRGSDLDAHFAPQYEYLSSLRMDCLIPMDRLEILDNLVAERSGQPFGIERKNVRRETVGADQSVCDEVRKLIEEYFWIDRLLYDKAIANCNAH